MAQQRRLTESIRHQLDGVLCKLIDELETAVDKLDELGGSDSRSRRDAVAYALAAAETAECTYVLLRVPRKEARLTPREREVALLAADGLRNKEISNLLGIREATVSAHVRRAVHKLRLKSRAELVLQRGVLQR